MWTLERVTDKAPLTTNRLLSTRSPRWRGACQATVKDWRRWAHDQAHERGWERHNGPVTVTYQYLRKTRTSRPIDTAASYLLGKAMLDGLVDANVLPTDSDDVVRSEHLISHAVAGHYGIRLVMRELAVADPVRSSLDVRTPASGVTLTGTTPLIEWSTPE